MHMKDRVTLTLAPLVTHRAKSVARARGTSFSGLVEPLLAAETGRAVPGDEPFHMKWAGKLKLAECEGPRFEYLRRKYQL